MEKRAGIIIALLVFCVAAFRIYAALSVPYLSDDVSYQNLRLAHDFVLTNIEHDPFSFGGRDIIVNPISLNVLALFTYLAHTIVGYKIFLNIIAALHIAVIFLISLRLTHRPLHAVLVAILAACVPVQYLVSLNSISILPIAMLFFLLALYYYIAYLQEPTKLRLIVSIALFLFCSILHPLFLVFLVGMLVYRIYCKILLMRVQPFEHELLVTSLLVAIVIDYIIYARAFLTHGLTAFYQSTEFVPYVHLSQVIPLLPQMGLVIFAASMYTLFYAFDTRQQQPVFLFAGIMTAAFFATAVRIISADIGLLIISLMSILLMAFFLDDIHDYFSQTKIHFHAPTIVWTIWIVFFILSLIPTLLYSRDVIDQSTNPQLVEAFQWINVVAEQNATVIVPIQDAQTAMFFAQRKTLMDQNTLLETNAQRRADTLHLLYTTPYPSTVLSALHDFGVTRAAPAYIIFSDQFTLPQGATQQAYKNDCFVVAFNNSAAIVYKSICEVREQ